MTAPDIIDLLADDEQHARQAAALLVDGFRDFWPDAWPDLDSALEEVRMVARPGHIARCAVDSQGRIAGWIGGLPQYDGHVWELHPLVVAVGQRGRGIGRALVEDLERQVAVHGGLTLWLGTDDEAGLTNLGGLDLYPNPLDHLQRLRDLGGHPFTFYQHLGFVVAGVLPDANGPGKPDIFMTKRVRRV